MAKANGQNKQADLKFKTNTGHCMNTLGQDALYQAARRFYHLAMQVNPVSFPRFPLTGQIFLAQRFEQNASLVEDIFENVVDVDSVSLKRLLESMAGK